MSKNLFDLTGKIALVTGASRGIGEAIARLLAENGAHVIVSSRKVADCQVVVDSIKENGGSAEALACHVGDMDQIAQTFTSIKAAHGQLDILVRRDEATDAVGSSAGQVHVFDGSQTLDGNVSSTTLLGTFRGESTSDFFGTGILSN